MSDNLVFLNRRFVPADQAGFSVFDRGLLYGDGLFETVRIYGGKFFRLAAHLRRMFNGLKALGIKAPYTHAEMEIFTRELAMTNRITEGFARIVVSRGEGFLGFSPRGCTTPHVAICVRERYVAMRRKEAWHLTAAKRPISPLPFKSLSYLPNVLAKKEAEDDGFDEAILFDAKGTVIEATGSNIFLWTDGKLITPPLSTGCLPGITRAEVIKVARREGFHLVEKAFGIRECRKAHGIFLTNSLLEIVPCYFGRVMDPEALSEITELEAAFAYHRITASR
ncbi:MAG: aminotransferase class IV [Verrucomicrobia bacterium]|nr:aminotransferase class IV [Verrucomicrobiota bacterium]